MNMTNQTETRSRVLQSLRDWATVGTVARRLGLSRSSVEREVASLRALGKLEARRQTFWRNGRAVEGREYRVLVIECGPARVGALTPDERRAGFLSALFECRHHIEVCEACVGTGSCRHRCIECDPDVVFREAS